MRVGWLAGWLTLAEFEMDDALRSFVQWDNELVTVEMSTYKNHISVLRTGFNHLITNCLACDCGWYKVTPTEQYVIYETDDSVM